MAKYVRIHLQISCDFFCHMRHSIETNLWTCNWPVNKIQVYKVVSIDRVSPNARSNGKCQNKKFLHFQMDIFCHFDFCHNRRNGFGSSTNHKPIKSLQTESVENLLKIGSQLLSAIQRCYIPSCQSRKTREHVFFLSSVLIVQVSPFLRRKIVKEAQSR